MTFVLLKVSKNAFAGFNWKETKTVLNHILNRIHFNQPPEVVLDYITTAKYWSDWHTQCGRTEGVTDRPMQVGDQCIEYVDWNNTPVVIQWTTVDRWKSNMYRMSGRRIADGKVRDDVTVTIHFTLFATEDGGTDFTREMEIVAPDLGPLKETLLRIQDQALQNLKKILAACCPE